MLFKYMYDLYCKLSKFVIGILIKITLRFIID